MNDEKKFICPIPCKSANIITNKIEETERPEDPIQAIKEQRKKVNFLFIFLK